VSSGLGGSNTPPSAPGTPFEPLGFAGGTSPGGGLGQVLFAALTLFFLLAATHLGRRLRPMMGLFWSPVFLALHERPG
jgi:hypothetical protein